MIWPQPTPFSSPISALFIWTSKMQRISGCEKWYGWFIRSCLEVKRKCRAFYIGAPTAQDLTFKLLTVTFCLLKANNEVGFFKIWCGGINVIRMSCHRIWLCKQSILHLDPMLLHPSTFNTPRWSCYFSNFIWKAIINFNWIVALHNYNTYLKKKKKKLRHIILLFPEKAIISFVIFRELLSKIDFSGF